MTVEFVERLADTVRRFWENPYDRKNQLDFDADLGEAKAILDIIHEDLPAWQKQIEKMVSEMH